MPAAALPHMTHVLSSRPSHFSSPQEAVQWALRTGMSKSKEAAAISLPSQLKEQQQQGETSGPHVWVWRTPLERSRPFWEGWYTGLSERFLQLHVPKMLLLAGTDRWG